MEWIARKEQENNPDAWEYEVISPSGTGRSHYRIASGMNKANAQLIASAPDLYEACKELLDWLDLITRSGDKDSRFIKAKQALAKAEGQ